MSKNKRLSQFECPDVASQRATGRLLSQLNKCKPKRTKPRSDGPADWSLPWGRKALAGNHVATNLLPKHTHSGRRSLLAPFLSPPCLSEQTLIGAPSTRMYLYLACLQASSTSTRINQHSIEYVQLAMCGAGMAR